MLRASGEAGRAWFKALPRVPGRARRRAGVLPSPLEPLQRRRFWGVSAAESGLAVGAGWRASLWESSKGDLGRSGADPGLALRQPALGYRDGS